MARRQRPAVCGAAVLRIPRARPVDGRAVDRRPEASAGPHRAQPCEDDVRRDTARLCDREDERQPRARLDRFPRRLRHPERRCGDRLDHLVHQHLEPLGHDRGRPHRAQRRGEGPQAQAMGQDLARPGIAGRGRLLEAGWPAGGPRPPRLPARRLWLRHMHRQFRAAAAGDLRSDQRERPHGDRRAVGQPQLRRPHQPGRQDELPRLAAARHRLCARRHDGLRLRDGAAGH